MDHNLFSQFLNKKYSWKDLERQSGGICTIVDFFFHSFHSAVTQVTDFVIDGRRSMIWELRLGD